MAVKSLFSVWTLLGLGAGLFALSLFAPKAWDSMRDRPLARMKGKREVVQAPAEPGRENRKRGDKQAVPIETVAKLESRPIIEETVGPSAAPPVPPVDIESDVVSAPPPVMPTELPSTLEAQSEPVSPPAVASINDDEEMKRKIAWPRPESLIAQLEELAEDPATSDWARRVIEGTDAVSALETHYDAQAPLLFDHLRKLAGEAAHLAHKLEPFEARVKLRRAEYALTRRLEVWDQIYAVSANNKSPIYAAIVEPRRLSDCLNTIEATLRGKTGADDWRKYLLLNKCWKLTQSGGLSENERRDMARAVLSRIESPHLNDTQQAFFRRPEFAELAANLRLWAFEPVDPLKLLQEIERYEGHSRRDPAHHVAEAFQSLRWSSDDEVAQLAERVETHYRNANLRIAVSGHLINRLLPEPKTMAENVAENIQGASVKGRSETEARLWVRLIPDRMRIRMGLEANGVVASETASSKGPATVHHDSLAHYSARKQLMIDNRGMKVWRTEAEANSEMYTRGIETRYDGLPIVSNFVRNIAHQKQQEAMGQAKSEMDMRVADRASERLDFEVHQKLQQAEQEFQAKVIAPLTKLQLQPTALGMETTAERLIVRYRLAGDHQLAAHTPRPQAPADSWLSMQIHQTAINNAIEQLQFDGKQTTVQDLIAEVAKALYQPVPKMPEELPTDVTLRFAEHDSVRVECQNGKLLLVVRLAELNAGRGNHWKNFEVRASLAPQTSGLDAQLLRDGTIELSGERLSLRDQVALRGIFSRVISKNKATSLLPEKLRNDPRLKDLAVQQFVVEDGWVSLALSPQRLVSKPASGKPHATSGKNK